MCKKVLSKNSEAPQIPHHHSPLQNITHSHVDIGLVEKPFQINIPKRLSIETHECVSFDINVSGEQALGLLDSSLFAWRANDELRHQIKAQPIDGLKCEFDVLVLKLA